MHNITENSSSIDNNRYNAEHGFFNGPLYEPSNYVEFNNSIAEKVISGENNTFIVLGRDRPSTLYSGYGGLGHSKAGCIDIVVGRISAVDATSIADSKVNPSFAADAARIYISQKSNIDEYFNIGLDPINKGEKANSAIGIKADDVRIIARNTLKLVTRTDGYLSNKNIPYYTTGVQLIANNDDSNMQPLVLGTNLVNALMSLINDHMQDLIGHLSLFVKYQKEFNEKIADHTHLSPFYSEKTSLSPQVIEQAKKTAFKIFTDVEQQLLSDASNLKSFESKYLIAGSKEYINSKFNLTN